MSAVRFLVRSFVAAALAVGAAIVALAPSPASAADIKVENLKDAGPGSLRDAIDQANATTELDVVVFDSSLAGTLTLTTGAITINQPVVIDASDAGEVLVSGDDASRIFRVLDAPLTIVRLGLTSGNAPIGGAIYADGDVTVRESVISSSRSSDFGGAIYALGDVTITGSDIKDNRAEYGGGIYASQVVVEAGSSVSDNRAVRGGGGIYATGGLTVRDSFIVDNAACTDNGNYFGGGGALVSSAPAVISDSAISGNTCVNESGGGLRIFSDTTLDIENSVFSDNSAAEGGAMRIADSVVATIDGGDFDDNTAEFSGGAISSAFSELTLGNSTFDGNAATNGNGGAVEVDNGGLTVTNSSFGDNTAGASGGAVAANQSAVDMTDTDFIRNSTTYSGGGAWLVDSTVLVTGGTIEANSANSGGGLSVRPIGDMFLDGAHFVGNQTTDDDGGGLYVRPSASAAPSVTLEATNLVFENNTAVDNGGAAYFGVLSSATITDVVATGNSAGYAAGAFEIRNTSGVRFVRGVVRNNTAPEGGAFSGFQGFIDLAGTEVGDNAATVGDGGGILATTSSVRLTDATLSGNRAAGSGGAVSAPAYGATVTILDSTLSDNVAETGRGGAVSSAGALVQVARSSFFDNRAAGEGGALALGGGFVGSSTFARNHAGADGGAIERSMGLGDFRLTVDASTFSANTSEAHGGALARNDSTLVLSESTLTLNEATVSGGGVFGADATSVVGSIVAGNVAPDAPEADVPEPPTDSIVGGNPLLEPLADNGGPTLTHMIGPRSPAIDLFPAPVKASEPVDQRGVRRDQDGGQDAGAVEYDGPKPVWIPITPVRLADTRSSGETIDDRFRGAGLVPGGKFVEIEIAGRGGVPDDATGAVVNVTAIRPAATGFLTVFPCTEARPNASSVNYTTGVNLPNEVAAGLSVDGSICVFSKEDTHISVDVVGYVAAPSPFVPVEPGRLLDTRDTGVTVDGLSRAGGRQPGRSELKLQVGGRYGIPADAAAVVVNVTAVRPAARGFLTVHGCVGERPLSSSLNYIAGGNRANEILAGLDDEGNLCIYTHADTDVLVDVVGFLPAGTDLTPVEPARVLETRTTTSTVDGRFAGLGKLPAGTTTRVQIAGRAGVADDAVSVNINVTAVAASSRGFVTVFPCGERPLAASLNYIPGVNGGNDLIAGLDADGGLCLYNLSETHLTVDIAGYTTL